MRLKVNFYDNNLSFKSSFQSLQIVDFTRPPVIQPLTVTENGAYSVPNGVDGFNPINVEVLQTQGEEYGGSYEVTPKAKEQILQTAEKVMREDLKIKAIPYREVPIVGGTGIAVIIG